MAELPIHIQYFMDRVLDKASAQFRKEWSIQLHRFLQPEIYKKAIALARAPLKSQYVPDQYCYHTFKSTPVIAKQLMRMVQSADFAAIISIIVGKKIRLRHAAWRVYQHGDYTVRHDKLKEPPGYDVLLDITQHWDERACGHHSFVQGGKEIVRISPMPNSLAIIKRPSHLQKFVKYANHHAGKDKRVVLEARFA